ncbi:MaoC family dehydratase (plasmid) [Streptomyces sp. GDS52]|uniref:MaoC family dehydratase n=1 Tax=Streptomyces sp. GDS52 TaxID=3406419 RepID=UPI003FD5DA23
MPVPLTIGGLADLEAATGAELGPSSWLEITQKRVNDFAEATGDQQWIHVDPERAAGGPFSTTIAHGYLTLSLISGLFGDLLDRQGISMAVNYGLNRVRFTSPVPVGSRIRLVGRIVRTERVGGDGLQVTYEFTVEIEGSPKPACVAESVHRYYA